jgi:DNA helicase-2/ATP-dependent DNA helicase PcrA
MRVPPPTAEDVIASCLDPNEPRSFFLYAGAGSGKTRALVEALDAFRKSHRRHFDLTSRKIGVITYTNAARDEIERRLGLDLLFDVSTIHSFCWSLIRGFDSDIRDWLKSKLPSDIAELQAQQAKGRTGTKAAQDRERGLGIKTMRLQTLGDISAFTYNPNGDNFGKDSLSHTEVLQITSTFLQNRRLIPKPRSFDSLLHAFQWSN